MRVAVAVLTLIIITVIHVAEPVLCPDGCRDEADQTARHENDSSDCLICHNGVSIAVMAPAFVSGVVLTAWNQDRDRRVPAPQDRRLDHPPRNT